ncbi:hypothetical protein O1L60_39205 [Streptomyces diastatochromogenes]|nr:hypothetical protein [Streptomyces diastatochromogenes]MCZ0982926.1 hypothetical protein [Streptomyces diastatochromogenes]
MEMIEAPEDGDLTLEVSTRDAGTTLRAEVRTPHRPDLTGLTARIRLDPHPPAAPTPRTASTPPSAGAPRT